MTKEEIKNTLELYILDEIKDVIDKYKPEGSEKE